VKRSFNLKKVEICNECGRSVSGLFVNRIPDLNDFEERKEMNKPYSKGDYICRECDEKIYCTLKGKDNA
jgi:ribosomal protein L34E